MASSARPHEALPPGSSDPCYVRGFALRAREPTLASAVTVVDGSFRPPREGADRARVRSAEGNGGGRCRSEAQWKSECQVPCIPRFRKFEINIS